MRRFVGPDVLREPLQERQAVGLVAEEGLTEMDVRLHQAGDDRLAGALDHFRAARADAADLLHSSFGDEHVGPQHAAARVHGDDRAASKEDHDRSRRRRRTFPVTRPR